MLLYWCTRHLYHKDHTVRPAGILEINLTVQNTIVIVVLSRISVDVSDVDKHSTAVELWWKTEGVSHY